MAERVCPACEGEHVICWAVAPAVGCTCCQRTMREIRRLRQRPATLQPFPVWGEGESF